MMSVHLSAGRTYGAPAYLAVLGRVSDVGCVSLPATQTSWSESRRTRMNPSRFPVISSRVPGSRDQSTLPSKVGRAITGRSIPRSSCGCPPRITQRGALREIESTLGSSSRSVSLPRARKSLAPARRFLAARTASHTSGSRGERASCGTASERRSRAGSDTLSGGRSPEALSATHTRAFAGTRTRMCTGSSSRSMRSPSGIMLEESITRTPSRERRRRLLGVRTG
jgi:hypothetical protein